MKVFLDTNVLVSGFATRGLCADVVRLVLAEHELLTTDVVLEELQRALVQKLRLPNDTVQDILAWLGDYLVQSEPNPSPRIRLSDKADLLILASALGAKADVFVTGDKDLLRVKKQVPELLITDPRGFWNRMRKPGTK